MVQGQRDRATAVSPGRSAWCGGETLAAAPTPRDDTRIVAVGGRHAGGTWPAPRSRRSHGAAWRAMSALETDFHVLFRVAPIANAAVLSLLPAVVGAGLLVAPLAAVPELGRVVALPLTYLLAYLKQVACVLGRASCTLGRSRIAHGGAKSDGMGRDDRPGTPLQPRLANLAARVAGQTGMGRNGSSLLRPVRAGGDRRPAGALRKRVSRSGRLPLGRPPSGTGPGRAGPRSGRTGPGPAAGCQPSRSSRPGRSG
jgi:hypothetical protein